MHKQPPRDLLGFFIYFLRPHWKLVLALAATGVLYGVLSVGTRYIMKLMIDALSNDAYSIEKALNALRAPAFGYIAMLIAEEINYRGSDIIKLLLLPALRKDIHNYSFRHLTSQSYSYFQNHLAGKISNRVSDLNSSVISIMHRCDEVLAILVKLLVAALILCTVNVYYPIILLTWCIGLLYLSYYYSKTVIILSRDFATSKSKLMGILVDCFANIINILSFANKKYESKLNRKQVNATVAKDKAMQWKVVVMRMWQGVTFIIMIGTFLVLSLLLYKRGAISVGDFVLTISLAASVAENMWWFAGQLPPFFEELGKCSQAIGIINTPIKIKDKPNAKDLVVTKGKISFENVTFYYNKKKSLFENKNITINPGEKIGLVGFTGSGKSSFINLIMRFYDPIAGKITIDGVDISTAKLSSLRRQISMIPQDTNLFHRSIKENIRYGDTEATDKEIIEAAKKAYCDDFINELPDKYDTMVGERGTKLSGGQRQRIAIARAFLKKAPIVIMDEATSALDSITERKIHDSLQELTKGRTTIVIAHRLSTLGDMDRILVFENGTIIQDGSHHSLVRQEGHYRKLWKMQADGFIPSEEE